MLHFRIFELEYIAQTWMNMLCGMFHKSKCFKAAVPLCAIASMLKLDGRPSTQFLADATHQTYRTSRPSYIRTNICGFLTTHPYAGIAKHIAYRSTQINNRYRARIHISTFDVVLSQVLA